MRRTAAEAMPLVAGVNSVSTQVIGSLAPAILSDPVLTASMKSTTRDNIVHWLARIAVDPALPVAPPRSRNAVEFASDLIRRGYDSGAIATYLSGQNAAWQLWMQLCFEATDDPAELHELLTFSARSIFTYVEAVIADIGSVMRAQRKLLTKGTTSERWELVTLILSGADVSLDAASARLGHDLRPQQTAVVFWRDPSAADIADLENAARTVGEHAGLAQPLVIFASTGSLWSWYPSHDLPDTTAMMNAVERLAHVRMAIGTTSAGAAGFRQSHADALTTQRLMSKTREDVLAATYEEVRIAAFVTEDDDRAHEFVTRTLGALATADPMLQETLRIYLREDASPARAARVLHTHRNTVLNRVARAQAMLPASLDGQGLAVALALEVVRWIGSGVAPRAR